MYKILEQFTNTFTFNTKTFTFNTKTFTFNTNTFTFNTNTFTFNTNTFTFNTNYEESVVVRFKSNLLLMIFWLHIINYNS